METGSIQRTICSKILRFLDSILVDQDIFRRQVMVSLAKIFGYNKTTFWMADRQGNLYEPLAFNIAEKFIGDYVGHHFENDILHPRKLGIDHVIRKKIIYLQDLISQENFEKTEYCDFLHRYRLHHELGLYFTDGDRLLGAMALLRSKHEKEFSAADFNILGRISKHISKALSTHLHLAEEEYQKKIFEAFSNQSQTGLIIFDKSFQIVYCNQAARDICADLTPREKWINPTERFIKNFLLDNIPVWQLGMKKTILSHSLKYITVHIVPAVNHRFKSEERHLYMTCLIPEDPPRNLVLPEQDGNWYNLTPREKGVLDLLLKGYSNQEIAAELFISINTVKRHLQSIFEKMNVSSRISLYCKINAVNNRSSISCP